MENIKNAFLGELNIHDTIFKVHNNSVLLIVYPISRGSLFAPRGAIRCLPCQVHGTEEHFIQLLSSSAVFQRYWYIVCLLTIFSLLTSRDFWVLVLLYFCTFSQSIIRKEANTKLNNHLIMEVEDVQAARKTSEVVLMSLATGK